ncbi:SAM-dependent methyltransferase [Micromonospora tulbaghiae]|uniref:SAM-dependent methyltransferase n=1 Tax=Micromonospora tulbaghiae TaxID=479978 RepID=A0A386WU37_9ACTN|nr:class I SAM-dependent methyltransferase [Micromonospora tulbaghiae]AYF31957.1 SAM-dependent methyltransferase [Micromonospora tulbaghiae]
MAQHVALTPELVDYVRRASLREDDVLRELREVTAGLPAGRAFQVMAEEGQLLALLVALTGARTVLEIGTYTGYSTLCMARALRPGGTVVTCDIDQRWPAIGRPYWERAGVADRIDLRIGDARKTLAELAGEWGVGGADLAFIDADKTGYREYYEAVLPLIRPGGLIVLDNTLFFGRVADPKAGDADTVAVREMNEFLYTDGRVDISLLVMADGITLARKRAGAPAAPRPGDGSPGHSTVLGLSEQSPMPQSSPPWS